MKQENQTPTQTPVSAGVAAMLKSGSDTPLGSNAKSQSNRDKAAGKGVTKAVKNYEAMGAKDACHIWEASKEAGTKMCETLTHLAFFAPLGFKPNEKADAKKRLFPAEVDSYFKGWKAWVDATLDTDKDKASFATKYAEARRVCHAYILKYSEHGNDGTMFVSGILQGPGTYQWKIASLPTMQTNPKKKGATTPNATPESKISELAKAEEAQELKIVSGFGEKEIGRIFAGLTEGQLVFAVNALAVRLQVSPDKANQEIGSAVRKLLESAKRAGAPIKAEDMREAA